MSKENDTVEIRPMAPADYERVRDIQELSYRWLAPRERWTAAQTERMTEDLTLENVRERAEKQCCWVAEVQGRIVGFVSVWRETITQIHTTQSKHGAGTGAKLFEVAQEAIRRAGYTKMGVISTQSSVPFYEKMRMAIVAQEISPEMGIPITRLEKLLAVKRS